MSRGGPGTFPHRYEAGKQQLQNEFGLKVIETSHALREAEWLHKNPKARAEDLMNAFADPMFVLPYGIQAEIDCEAQKFSILENAVVD